MNIHPKLLSDEKIIDLFWQRDEQAISQTDTKYGKYLYKIAYNILNDRLDSEECQNDTYLAAWDAIPPHKPLCLPAFLTQLIRRISIDRYRESRRQKRIPTELIVSMEELHGSLANVCMEPDQLGYLLSDFIRSLPKQKQELFMSRYYFNDSIADIARSLRLSESAIYKELKNIRNLLKSYLTEKDIDI